MPIYHLKREAGIRNNIIIKIRFFFTHRTVIFIRGEVLINIPTKLQKAYENEITKISIDDFSNVQWIFRDCF